MCFKTRRASTRDYTVTDEYFIYRISSHSFLSWTVPAVKKPKYVINSFLPWIIFETISLRKDNCSSKRLILGVWNCSKCFNTKQSIWALFSICLTWIPQNLSVFTKDFHVVLQFSSMEVIHAVSDYKNQIYKNRRRIFGKI